MRPRNGNNLEAVQDLAAQVEAYEQKGPILQLQTTWAVTQGDGASDQSESIELGVRLHSSDDKYVLQIRTNGVTL